MVNINKRFVLEAIDKLEIALEKELEIYQALLTEERKKIDAIIDRRLQDLDLYIDRQTDLMQLARNAGAVRKQYLDDLALLVFPRCNGGVALKDIFTRLPLEMTIRLVELRVEVNATLYRIKALNKVVPRIMTEGMDIYKKSRDILASTKKIGYTNRGKESALTERLSTFVDRKV